MGIISVSRMAFEQNINCLTANNSIIITLGKGSYIAGAECQYGDYDEIKFHVSIGNYCSIATDVNFIAGYNHDYNLVTTTPIFLNFGIYPPSTNKKVNSNQIIIGNDVWIGSKCTIMGGVKIGNGAVIGANCIVTKNVPPYAIVAGNPGRIIKYRFPLDIIKQLNKIKWWYWPKDIIQQNIDSMNNPQLFVSNTKNIHNELYYDKFGENIISQLKLSTKKIFLLPIDMSNVFTEWKKAIELYLSDNIARKSIILLVLIGANCIKSEIEKELYTFEYASDKIATIFTYNLQHDEYIGGIVKCVDCIISTKSPLSGMCIDYALDYDVDVRYIYDDGLYDIDDKN